MASVVEIFCETCRGVGTLHYPDGFERCDDCAGLGHWVECLQCNGPNSEPISDKCPDCLEQDEIARIQDEAARLAAGLASDKRARRRQEVTA